MKHIFYVQSNLSRLVCQAILRKQRIAPSDAVFVLDRGTKAAPDIAAITAPRWLRFAFRRSVRRIFENRCTRRRIRSLFDELSGKDAFTLYVNRMNYSFVGVVETIPEWRGTNLYEEGFAAYSRTLGSVKSGDKDRIWDRLKYRLISGLSGYGAGAELKPFYTTEYNTAFATSPKAFKDFPRREIVDIRTIIAAEIRPSGFVNIPEGSLIIVLPLHNAFSSDLSARGRLLDSLVGVIRALPERPVVFKPHPDLDDKTDFWTLFFEDLGKKTGIDVRECIQDELQLEEIALARKDVVFCTVISSMAIYAGLFEMNLISVAPAVFGVDDPRVVNLRQVANDSVFLENPNSISEQLLCAAQFKERI